MRQAGGLHYVGHAHVPRSLLWLYPLFQREVSKGITDGQIKYREDIVDGLENAPAALLGMLEGKNFGKLIIRVRVRSSP